MPGVSLKVKRRQLALLVIFFLIIVALIVRVAYIQVVKGAALRKMAYEQHNRGMIISPRRGTIYDRNGKELAKSASVDTVWVLPREIANSEISIEQIASDLAKMLGMDSGKVYKVISANTSYNVIKSKIEKDMGNEVRKWIAVNKVKGISVEEDSKRYYPNRNLASHVLGFTGTDNEGLEGLEVILEKYLKGIPGKIISELDGSGQEMPFSVEKRIPAQQGMNVVLTIDETIQYMAEKALERAIFENKIAGGATAIVMDPRNGDILALASKPDFDPNDPYIPPEEEWMPTFKELMEIKDKDMELNESDLDKIDMDNWSGRTNLEVLILRASLWRNKALIDTYEPGSTFKAITSAAGLEEGVVTPETQVNDNPVELAGYKLKCWRDGNLHGQESFREGVYNSCNPVFVRVAQALGIEKFYQYVNAFGFKEKTGILLPEGRSIFHIKPQELDMAVSAFGQGFQITPIQLASAYSAIANNGTLVKPRIVKELTDNEGNILKSFEPEEIRNVISRQTCDTLLDILQGVVSEGTGKNAYVKGYRVAGKTGTSETLPRGSGRYIASFAAIAPADNPVITALVILDDPRGYSYMGGVIAAPVAGKLVEDVLSYLGVERNYSEKDMEMMTKTVYVPELRNKPVAEAKKMLRERVLEVRVESGGEKAADDTLIVEMTPKPGASIPEKSVVILYTYKPEKEIMVKVPNLSNMTIAEATRALNDVGLNIKISGMGIAMIQEVQPGELVAKGTVIEVKFRHIDNVE